jgi:hypothetical protein
MEIGDWVTAAARIRERAVETAVELDNSHTGLRPDVSRTITTTDSFRRRGRRRRPAGVVRMSVSAGQAAQDAQRRRQVRYGVETFIADQNVRSRQENHESSTV